MARAIADNDAWTPIHLVIIVGIMLMLGGLLALYRSIPAGLARALAGLGWAAAVAGIAVGLVLVILDGVAARQLAEGASHRPTSHRTPNPAPANPANRRAARGPLVECTNPFSEPYARWNYRAAVHFVSRKDRS